MIYNLWLINHARINLLKLTKAYGGDMMKTNRLLIIFCLLGVVLISATAFAEGKTIPQMIGEAKSQIAEVTVQEIKADIDAGKNFVLLDVRTSEEYKAGHLPKSVNIPRGMLEFEIGKAYPNKETLIVLYCGTSGRGALCTNALMGMGYKNVKNMQGGLKAWGETGYSIYNLLGEFKLVAFQMP
jgi:rhodanese-related sulfurtransferase